jgi:hypothetical protein
VTLLSVGGGGVCSEGILNLSVTSKSGYTACIFDAKSACYL